MRNSKETVLHDPSEGIYVVIHVPSGARFIIEGHDPGPYLRDCMLLKDHPGFGKDEGDSLTVLTDIKLQTRYQFSEFIIRPQCPGQVSKLIEYVTKASVLEIPKIVVSESFFKHIYGLDKR